MARPFSFPKSTASGQTYLEPIFGHFFLYRIEKVERGVIFEKGLFYAGIGDLDISAAGLCSLAVPPGASHTQTDSS